MECIDPTNWFLRHRGSVLEPTASSDFVRKKINALCSAFMNLQQQKTSVKIRRALRYQARMYAEDEHDNGDKVYFKRKDF